MKKLVFTIDDMHCVNCAMRLQELEDSLTGVLQVDASYRHGKMTVSIDETTVSADQIIAEVKKIGYTARLAGG
ncbi:MAG TPA: heavy-metal-associated domain-containing protein [Anaerolineaceae bacterium]|nr:heavy-metal-associated domain-containing protein [Anaerolineaceae bacterium]